MTDLPASRPSGMTVNERLHAAGLLPDFEAAAKGRDRERMKALLQQAGLTEDQASYTTDTILTNPSHYGY